MLEKIIINFLLILFCFACRDVKQHVSNKDTIEESTSNSEIEIWRTSDPNLVFTLKIDSSFYYHDSLVNKKVTMGYKIGTIKKVPNKVSTVYLKINNEDTLFQMPMYNYSKVMFGPKYKNKFYIVNDSADLRAWIID